MKIAFLSRWQGINYRGAETYVAAVSSGLSALGHRVDIYPVITHGVPADTQVVIGVNGRADNALARAWCWFRRAKLIVSGQSGLGIDDRFNLWCFPDTFVALTEHHRLWASRVNPFVPNTVIPNGVDPHIFHPQIKALHVDLPRPLVLCVAALTVDKRADLAIRAVSQMPTGSLLLAGTGPQKEELSRLGRQLLPGRFQIISRNHSQMPAVYTAADVFTYPTVPWESFGIALLEAMASGLPVVASDDPIRREIVGTAGLFINPADTAAYAAALNRVLQKSWDQIPRRQAQKFTWSKIITSYDTLIRNLCSR